MASNLYFMAILTPEEVSTDITAAKNYIARQYHSEAALKSPPHITLVPPFHFESTRETELFRVTDEFAKENERFDCEIKDYGAFIPRVIFADILPNKKLEKHYRALNEYLEKTLNLKNRSTRFPTFSPHITVAFKDLSPENFYQAWDEFKARKIHFSFVAKCLAVLKHNGSKWEAVHCSILKAL